jgi:hypothetical protein
LKGQDRFDAGQVNGHPALVKPFCFKRQAVRLFEVKLIWDQFVKSLMKTISVMEPEPLLYPGPRLRARMQGSQARENGI